ncbi:MAG: hypothetical protein HY235_26470 [Acidobacteria bacterium]|nr:hypothetical protein [Acidobacteriota bacterium]
MNAGRSLRGVEPILKAVSIAGAVCYVTGLLVTNAALSRYGVYTTDLLRVDYIIAGLYALAPLVVLAAAMVLARESLKEAKGWQHALGVLAGTMVGVLIALSFISWPAGIKLISTWFGSVFIGVLTLFGAWRILVEVVPGWVQEQKSAANNLEDAITGWMTLAVALAVFGALPLAVAYLVVFSRDVYGEIPVSRGGAKPREVTLVLSSEGIAALKGFGVGVGENAANVVSARLVLEKDAGYVFLFPDANKPRNERTILIRRDLVPAMRLHTTQ